MFDIINMFYIFTIFLIISKYYTIKNIYWMIILLHFFGIFIFNEVLFAAEYMPDQFKYLDVAKNIRNLEFFNENNFLYGKNVFFAGLFFGLFPIPFIDTIFSIAMINFLLYFNVFIFMNKKGFFKFNFIAYFYLLYPSLFLYSSLALRDMLVFVVLFYSIFFITVGKNNIIGFIILFSLILIKFQNLLIFILSYLFSAIVHYRLKLKHLLLAVVMFLIVYFIFHDFFSLEKLNFYRKAFYSENINHIQDSFFKFTTYMDVFVSSPLSIVNMLLRPLPWKEFGIFQIIQFLENCFILILIIYILLKNKQYDLWKYQEVRFLNFLLFIALLIYGLVVFNSGTAVRYKFPFIVNYIIYSFYFIGLYKKG